MRQHGRNFCAWLGMWVLGSLVITGCTGGNQPPKDPPAPGMKRFVNSRTGLTGSLAEHYIDFHFDYPDRWDLHPRSKSDTVFVGVARLDPDGKVLETFNVGNWYSTGPGSEEALPFLLKKMLPQFQRQLADFQLVSEGPTKVAGLSGYEIRFTCTTPKTGKAYGRVVFQVGGKRGVTFTMFASELDPQFQSVDDVGIKGEMPKILSTFTAGR